LATKKIRCLGCGAPTPAAHKLDAPNAYPIDSISDATSASQSLPVGLSTCSPKTTEGWHWLMRWWNAGHRCRSSANPEPLPAELKGWHGQDPVHTGRSFGHPASCRARLHPPMPAKKWHWVNPVSSLGTTSSMDRSSTIPSGMCPRLMSSRSQAAAFASCSL